LAEQAHQMQMAKDKQAQEQQQTQVQQTMQVLEFAHTVADTKAKNALAEKELAQAAQVRSTTASGTKAKG